MKQFFINLLSKIKNIKPYQVVLIFTLTVFMGAGAIVLAVFPQENAMLEVFSYLLYALSAIMLTLSVLIVVYNAKKVKNSTVNLIKKSTLGKKMLEQYGFRAVVFAGVSLFINALYVVFHVVMGFYTKMYFWYGFLALYYLALACLKGIVVLYQRTKRKVDKTTANVLQIKKYRFCGVILMLLPICLVPPILQTAFLGKAFVHAGLSIFAFAAYAFYKIIMAIYNVFKSKKQQDLTIQAVKNIGFSDALVSIFALQTALLYEFSVGVDNSIFNIVTGCAVCVLTITLGIIMVLGAKKRLKTLKQG